MKAVGEQVLVGRALAAADATPDATPAPGVVPMKIMLVDGNSLTYRAFFALPTDLTTASGQVTNAVFGFTSMLINLVRDHTPDRIIVTFDRPEPTFRHEMVDDLQGQPVGGAGHPAPADGSGPPGGRGAGAADPRPGRHRGRRHHRHPGDHGPRQRRRRAHRHRRPRQLPAGRGPARQGALQQARRVRLRALRRGRHPRAHRRHARRATSQYAALRGDPSDNLPGIPGVGEKTAAKLITKYGGLDGIFAHVDEQTPKLRQNLVEHEAQARSNAEMMVLLPRRRPGRRARGAPPAARSTPTRSRSSSSSSSSTRSTNASARPSGDDVAPDVVEVDVLEAEVTEIADAAAAVALLGELAEPATPLAVAGGWDGKVENRRALLGAGAGARRVAGRRGLDPGDAARPSRRSATRWPAWSAPVVDRSPRTAPRSSCGRWSARTRSTCARWRSTPRWRPTCSTRPSRATCSPSSSSATPTAQLPDASLGAGGPARLRRRVGGRGARGGPSRRSASTRWCHPCSRALDAQGLLRAARRHRGAARPGAGPHGGHRHRRRHRAAAGAERPDGGRVRGAHRADLGRRRRGVQRELHRRSCAPCCSTTSGSRPRRRRRRASPPTPPRSRSWRASTRSSSTCSATARSRSCGRPTARRCWPRSAPDGRIHATFNQTVARTGRLSSDAPNLHNIPVRSEMGRGFRSVFVPSAGPRVPGGGLQPDRAALHRPPRRGPGAHRGVRGRRGHPHRDRGPGVRRGARRGRFRAAGQGEDGVLRPGLRDGGLRAGPAALDPDRRRRRRSSTRTSWPSPRCGPTWTPPSPRPASGATPRRCSVVVARSPS